jgi:hypothetical protein
MSKKTKTKKPYNWHTKLVSAIRNVWRHSPTRLKALKDAEDPHNQKHVICANCKTSVHQKLSTVEHLDPVVPVTGFDSWDAYIARMQSENLAVFCESCAKEKTKAENAQRATIKREAKKAANRSNKK